MIALALFAPPYAAAADAEGKQIFKARCAVCHGSQGEGTKKYDKRLEGDRSAAQLAELIHETMPQDDPGSLSPEEAQAVAAYVHDAFYSAIARERNRPARIELSRLTVRQHRQALADLVGSFRSSRPLGKERGLKGEYYNGRRIGRGSSAMERIDALIDFNFGTEAPSDKLDAHGFSIRWSGSLLAPETGEYEFAVRTEHAARLWVNSLEQPLIDAWVKSGNDTEFKAVLFLIGGRAYPLKLDFSKARQGVDDSKKQKTKPPPVKASLALCWKRPHAVLEPIPTRQLSPGSAVESFVCSTSFPPDDRSYGWERGATISQAWDEAATEAALETGSYIAGRLDELANARENDSQRKEKLREFCRIFAERAFRRPLTAEQSKTLIDKQFDSAKDADTAVKRSVLLALKSPQFLYREIGGTPDPNEVAARLSFGLWDSIPDQELIAAARAGRLATRQQIVEQAEPLLGDPRAKAKLRGFLLTWLKADHDLDLAKDAKKFPGFDAAVIADLRASLELFLDDVLWSERSDFRELLLADDLFLNGRLAKFYGAELPANAPFTRVKLDGDRRAGVLTHPYLMTSFAHSGESSPIHRGVFLARGVLGMSLRPPPEAVAPLAPELHPKLTTRERVALQTRPTACMSCHSIINPLGFTLEHFDAVGRYREQDRGQSVNALGSYLTRAGRTVTLKNARELAEFLAGSDEAHAAFIEQLFHHLVQQPVRAYGKDTLDELRRSFAANGFNIRKLAVEVMATSALQAREPPVGASRTSQ
jgi:hypothetical protein